MNSIFRFLLLAFLAMTCVNILVAQWVQLTSQPKGKAGVLAVSGTNLFVGTSADGISLSTDNGTSWTQINNGLASLAIGSLAVSGANLFAGTAGGGAHISTNNGASWTQINSGLTNLFVNAFAFSSGKVFAGTWGGGVFLSTNNGTNWIQVDSGLTNNEIFALAASDTNLFASGYGDLGTSHLFRSTNNGKSWSISGDLQRTTIVYALAVSGTNIFAGTANAQGGIYVSTNNGTNWLQAVSGIDGTDAFEAFAVSGTNIFAGNMFDGVYLTTNNGKFWKPVNTGMGGVQIFSIAVSGTNVFVTTESGVWKRPLLEIISSVQSSTTESPTQFNLEQNFPNPFNPSTTISFILPSRSFVSLKVFDTYGRQVSNLISESLPAGHYTRKWNATGLASGLYFYHLEAASYSETKKLILLK